MSATLSPNASHAHVSPSTTISPESKPVPQRRSAKFWGTDPNVLLESFAFFPTSEMNYNEMLNAVTRSVLLFSALAFFLSSSAGHKVHMLLITGISLAVIYLFWASESKKSNTDGFYNNSRNMYLPSAADIEKQQQEEANTPIEQDPAFFASPAAATVASVLDVQNSASSVFDTPTPNNPFCNTSPVDYGENPHKKPAPPLASAAAHSRVVQNVKQLILESNPGIADSVDKLLRDFGDELTLEQSIGRGYSMPNTQIPNDRELFEQFIYGNMKSCKEGNSVACAQNNSRHISI